MASFRHDQLHDPGHRAIFSNSIFVALGQGSVALLFLVYIMAARALGDAAFGEFTLGGTIATLLFTLTAWGTNRYASISAARAPDRTDEILSSSLGLMAGLAFLYFPLVWLVGRTISNGSVIPAVAVVMGFDLLAREYGNLLRLLLRVHGRFALDTASVFAERGLMVAGAAAVLLARPDPVLLAVSFAAGRTIGALFTNALYRLRVGVVGFRFELGSLRQIFVGGTPLAIRRGIADLSFRVDMVFLGAMGTASELGWYGVVYRLMDGVVMLPSVVTGSLGPTLSANFGEGRRDVVNRLYHRGARYLLIGGLFLVALFAVLPAPIVVLLYGAEYAPAATALRLLAPAVLFIFLRRNANEVLDNVDLRSTTVWIFGLGLLTNVALNFLLVPTYGYLGAAAATVVTEACVMIGMIRVLFRAGYSSAVSRELKAAVPSAVVAAILMWALSGSPLVAVLVGAAGYVAGLTILGAWDEKDVLLMRTVGRRLLGRSPPQPGS